MKRAASKQPKAVPAVTAADDAAKKRPEDATEARRSGVEPVRVLPGMWPNGPDV